MIMNLIGLVFRDSGLNRRFFIQNNYGGCSNDAGWFLVVEGSACSWEQRTTRPYFIYSGKTGRDLQDSKQYVTSWNANYKRTRPKNYIHKVHGPYWSPEYDTALLQYCWWIIWLIFDRNISMKFVRGESNKSVDWLILLITPIMWNKSNSFQFSFADFIIADVFLISVGKSVNMK